MQANEHIWACLEEFYGQSCAFCVLCAWLVKRVLTQLEMLSSRGHNCVIFGEYSHSRGGSGRGQISSKVGFGEGLRWDLRFLSGSDGLVGWHMAWGHAWQGTGLASDDYWGKMWKLLSGTEGG